MTSMRWMLVGAGLSLFGLLLTQIYRARTRGKSRADLLEEFPHLGWGQNPALRDVGRMMLGAGGIFVLIGAVGWLAS